MSQYSARIHIKVATTDMWKKIQNTKYPGFDFLDRIDMNDTSFVIDGEWSCQEDTLLSIVASLANSLGNEGIVIADTTNINVDPYDHCVYYLGDGVKATEFSTFNDTDNLGMMFFQTDIHNIAEWLKYGKFNLSKKEKKQLKDCGVQLRRKSSVHKTAAPFISLQTAVTGKTVLLGTYPQSKKGNQKTPIEWIVLDRNDNHVFLLSQYGLDYQNYDVYEGEAGEPYIDKVITWETCTLRQWLNEDFLSNAFTKDEQKIILTTTIDNSAAQGYGDWSQSGGNDTEDRIFLLSYAQANQYLNVVYDGENENINARVSPTDYARNKAARSYGIGEELVPCVWWLRSPGIDEYDNVASVDDQGCLYCTGAEDFSFLVRPCLWIDLEAIHF